jgi:hypothetical protein
LILDVAVARARPREGEERAIQQPNVTLFWGTAFFFGRTVIGGCLAFAKREMEWE